MSNDLLSSRTLLRWCANSSKYADVEPPDIVDPAVAVWKQIRAGHAVDPSAIPSGSSADFGYCLRDLLFADQACPSVAAVELFQLLSSLEWDSTGLAEKQDVLADIAYASSVRFRGENDYPSMRSWEDKCVSLLLETEPAATFLRTRDRYRSGRADQRFLARPATLLAVCRQLERDRNYRPANGAASAVSAFTATQCVEAPEEELRYLRGTLALSAAMSFALLGDFDAHRAWIETARELFLQTSFPAAMLVGVSLSDLTTRHVLHDWEEVLHAIDPVIEEARQLGVRRSLLSLSVLRAHTLKDLGRFDEARTEYLAIDAENPVGDPMILAVNLVGLAEVQHGLGEFYDAEVTCRRACELVEKSDAALSWGFLHSLFAQIYRDTGRRAEALAALDRSIEAYSAGGLVHLKCYVTICSAELLLGMGRTREGVARLMAALAILRETRVPNEVAAVAELLRAAMGSGLAPTPQAVRELGFVFAKYQR